jgi:hypothetical protein
VEVTNVAAWETLPARNEWNERSIVLPLFGIGKSSTGSRQQGNRMRASGRCVTKNDLRDFRHDIEIAMSRQIVRLLTWMTGMLAQAALVVALLQYLH